MMDLEGTGTQQLFWGDVEKSGSYDTLRASESTLTHGYPFGGVRVLGGKFPWSYGCYLRLRDPGCAIIQGTGLRLLLSTDGRGILPEPRHAII